MAAPLVSQIQNYVTGFDDSVGKSIAERTLIQNRYKYLVFAARLHSCHKKTLHRMRVLGWLNDLNYFCTHIVSYG